jgi:hypothetical protein
MGFQAWVIERLTWEDLETKAIQKKLEFLWEPKPSTGILI